MKLLYTPIKLAEDCDSLRDAEMFISLWTSMINNLAEKHVVYLRIKPRIVVDEPLGEPTKYTAMTRFTVGDPKIAGRSPGLME